MKSDEIGVQTVLFRLITHIDYGLPKHKSRLPNIFVGLYITWFEEVSEGFSTPSEGSDCVVNSLL